MGNNLESELLDEELADFFNEDSYEKSVDEKDNKQEFLEELLDVFSVKQDFSKLKDIKSVKDVKEKIEKINANIKGLEAVYGEDITNKLKVVLENEEEIDKVLAEFIDRKEEIIKRFITVENATVGADDNEEIKRMFMRFVAIHPEVDTLFLVMAIEKMIDIRNEKLSENSSNGGEDYSGELTVEQVEDPNLFALEFVPSRQSTNLNNNDIDSYLESFYKKVELIEKYAGITLDSEFISYFTDPKYILSNNFELPELMQDENYEKLQETWSLPYLINDSREEEMDKELYKADEQVKSMEEFYASNYGDTRDNSVIQTIKGLSNDVEEEKDRISKDIEFFKKEKIKEKVEVAILSSIKGIENNKKLDTLGYLLKDSISSRMNYLKEEENLRRERKDLIGDKSNKDNENNSKDYFEALGSVNKAIDERREKRAKGYVSFVPEVIKVSKARRSELERNNEINRDENSINGQDLSLGGRQKVLRYVNNYSNNNNIEA